MVDLGASFCSFSELVTRGGQPLLTPPSFSCTSGWPRERPDEVNVRATFGIERADARLKVLTKIKKTLAEVRGAVTDR